MFSFFFQFLIFSAAAIEELKDETIALIKITLVTLELGCFIESLVKIQWQFMYWRRISCLGKSSWHIMEITFLI